MFLSLGIYCEVFRNFRKFVDFFFYYLADEIFIVGTANEILPVVEVDGRTIGCGRPGSMTLEIQGFYDLVVRGEVGDFSDYLDWV